MSVHTNRMVASSSRVRMEHLYGNRWRLSVVCFSGHVAAVEGDLARIARIAARADRLLSIWAARNAARTTVPPPRSAPHVRQI